MFIYLDVYISEMRYYVHYLHFSDYCPHLCCHVYHNVSAVVRSGLLQVVGMSNLPCVLKDTLYSGLVISSDMARGIRTVYPGKRNNGLSSTFQTPEEGRNIQRSKRCDKHVDKDEDNCPKNVNNVI